MIQKLNLERLHEIYESVVESGKEVYAEVFLPGPNVSIEELPGWIKEAIDEQDHDKSYDFYICCKAPSGGHRQAQWILCQQSTNWIVRSGRFTVLYGKTLIWLK